MAGTTMRPAIFFDRDGVLNEDRNYVHAKEDFFWIAGAKAAIKLTNRRNYYVFVVTNQAGVARGYYGESAVRALHSHMQAELAEEGAHIDDFRYCPHHPSAGRGAYRRECECRKPAPGMINDLLRSWPVDASRSFLIGDKESDIEAAAAAGLRGHLFAGGDLDAFVRDLLGEED